MHVVFVFMAFRLGFATVFPSILALLLSPPRFSRLLRIQPGVYFVPGLNTYVNA